MYYILSQLVCWHEALISRAKVIVPLPISKATWISAKVLASVCLSAFRDSIRNTGNAEEVRAINIIGLKGHQ